MYKHLFFNCLISADIYDEYMAWKHSLSPLKSYHSFKYLVLKKMCLPSPDIHWFYHSSGSADLHLVSCSIFRIYSFCLASLIYLLLHFLSSSESTFKFWVLQSGLQIFFTQFPCMFFFQISIIACLRSWVNWFWHLLSFSYKWLCLTACLKSTHSMNTHKTKAILEKCQRKNISQVTELHLKSRY